MEYKLARQIKLSPESIRSRKITSKKNCIEGKQIITPLAIVVLLEERSHYVLRTLIHTVTL